MTDDTKVPLEALRAAGAQRLRDRSELAWYTLTTEQQGNHVHVVVTGTNSKEAVFSYLEEILDLCVARNCFRVLIEERLTGPRLALKDVLEIVNSAQEKAAGRFPTIAYVDVNATGPGMEYAEAAAAMRGMTMQLFPTVDEARRWLG